MPKEQILELIKDKPELAKELEDTYGLADAAAKIKTANAELTTQRESWTSTEKTLKAEVDRLKESLKSAEKPGSGVSQADFNALKESLDSVTKELSTEKEWRKKAESDRIASELKASIVSAATEAADPEAAFVLMQAKGLAGVGEDGKAFYRKLNEKGEPVTAKPSEAVSDFLDKNKFLKKPSGSRGSGERPENNGVNDRGLMKDPVSHL